MRPGDRYHEWVEWSAEDGVTVGRCPDVTTGIHGDVPVALYGELCDVVDEVVAHLDREGRQLQVPRIHPMREVV